MESKKVRLRKEKMIFKRMVKDARTKIPNLKKPKKDRFCRRCGSRLLSKVEKESRKEHEELSRMMAESRELILNPPKPKPKKWLKCVRCKKKYRGELAKKPKCIKCTLETLDL